MGYLINHGVLYNFDLLKTIKVKYTAVLNQFEGDFKIIIEFTGIDNAIESDSYTLKIPNGMFLDDFKNELIVRIIKLINLEFSTNNNMAILETVVANVLHNFI